MGEKKQGIFGRNLRRITHPEEQTAEQSRRAPRVLIGVLVVLVLAALITWALRVWVFNDSTDDTATSPSSTVSAEQSQEPPAEASCTLDTSQKDVSEEPPSAERWIAMRYLVIPEVAGAGPCDERDGYSVGFASTMTGAVMAAYYYGSTMYVTAPTGPTRDQAEYAFVDGQIKDALLQEIDDVNNGVQPRATDEQLSGADLVGYRVSSYAQDSAVIDVLGQSTMGSYWSGTVRLVWQDNDWKIDPVSPESWSPQQSLKSIRGFVMWDRSGSDE